MQSSAGQALVKDERHGDLGSVRKAWRPYLEHLRQFPLLQRVAFETAAFFTHPRELEFNLPRTFHERYVVAELLGEGAFGHVHRVEAMTRACARQALDLDLAVKIVPKQRVVSLKDYLALRQEGRMMLLLGGTLNVVHFFGAYEDDENVYLVMEHCVGGDAAQRLEKLPAAQGIQEDLVALYMMDILHVVAQCHQVRILHGDLKLDNFLFADKSDDAPLKLTDFGGACFVEPGQEIHGVRGTPLYTAPEVLYTGYSFPADVWSCGVILYRLLAGRFPFQGDLLDERIRYEEIDLESEPWPQISKQAKDLVGRLLERDISKRLTAEQALRHPWLASAEHYHHDLALQNAPLNGTMVQRLQFYRTLNGFQQAALLEVSRLLPVELKQQVMVLFGEIAVPSSDGWRVGIHEFAQCLKIGGYKLTQGETKSFLSRLDLDGDGWLSCDEFCTAFLDWSRIQHTEQLMWSEAVNQVFDSMDHDSDGRLAVEDLAVRLLPTDVATRRHHSFLNDVKRCFEHGDLDGDSWIDRNEFQAMLQVKKDAYMHFARRLYKSTHPT